jgi:acetyl-CoA carboxylase carboxyl transferase subunit beta
MQLVKTMGAVERVKAAGVPYISVMTDPTTGGTFASFASVGDINIAEPNALIRFAGDRVSSGTISEELPPGYARAEFWFSHGFVDRIVQRSHLRDEIIALLGFLIAPSINGAGDPTTAAGLSSRPRSFLSALTGALGGESNAEARNGEASGSRGEAPRG